MNPVPIPLLAASTVRSMGVLIAVVAVLGFVAYVLVNLRAGHDEIGSEIELAPNRKPYLDDEALEGPKLDRSLLSALCLLGLLAVALPLYWLNEPGRQAGAEEEFNRIFAGRGEEMFAPTADGGFNCAGCHGEEGVGGSAAYTLTDAEGEFVATVNWKAPALNTVLSRYSLDEVTFILTYGRPFSPMSAWGTAGGGPLNDQQISNLIEYIKSFQITADESRDEVEGQLRKNLGLGEGDEIDYDDPRVGELLFNLGREDGFAGGAYACGRCHTRGWSMENGNPQPAGADLSDYLGYPDGSGALGPSLRYPVVPRQFLSVGDLSSFLGIGSEEGLPYGVNGQGSGKMPGFGDNPNTEDVKGDGMLSSDMVEAIARYVRSLPSTTEEP